MAKNIVFEPGYQQSVVCSSPASPESGDPVRVGKLTGIALTDESEGGNETGDTTVDFGPMVVEVTVDDNEGTGIAVGDPIYYHDAGTGTGPVHLNNTATAADAFFGIAEEVVLANATTSIRVFHFPVGLTSTMSGVVGNGQLGAAAVSDENLDTGLDGSADGLGLLRVARYTFDPTAVVGQRGIGAHGLGVTLPDNALVLYGIEEILTTFTSATDAGTIALKVEGANDLVTATAISSGTFWDAVLSKVAVPDALRAAGIATAIKLTAAREITATVAIEALTGGKLVGWLFYVVGA